MDGRILTTHLQKLYEDILLGGDGKYSFTEIGVVITGGVFTAKMLEMPDDPMLWALYMCTVGGYALLAKLIAARLA